MTMMIKKETSPFSDASQNLTLPSRADCPGGCPGKEDEAKKDANDKSANAEVASILFEKRKVLIFGQIDDKIAREVTARLLALSQKPGEPIDIYVNSPGGHVESGDTIHDMIRFISTICPINMIGTGWVASAGALIYAAGEPDRRICLPNTRFLLHQPMGGVQGQATDIDIEAREIIKMRERLNRIFAAATGQDFDKIAKDTNRNYWISAQEAIAYGLVKKIIHSPKEIEN